jgi:cholesterol 7-dehydrogenase
LLSGKIIIDIMTFYLTSHDVHYFMFRSWFADATMPRNLVWYIVGNWIAQYQNDIFIWENKKFLKSPFLVKGDGPMNKQRRWFKQFYPAQPAGDAKDSMDW